MAFELVGEIGLKSQVRHACFLSEDRLAYITPAADVWQIDLGTASAPELLYEGRQVLRPLAELLGGPDVSPAVGGYPRLVASPRTDWLVVNTHDTVLLACPLGGSRIPRPICAIWGVYYPSLLFSPDGSWFSARHDRVVVFDTDKWEARDFERYTCCAWHPVEPRLLCVAGEGSVGWLDLAKGFPAHTVEHPLGEIACPDAWNDVVGLSVDATGKGCLVALRTGQLSWWQLEPWRLLETVESGGGALSETYTPQHGRWVAVQTESGVGLWSHETRRPLTDHTLAAAEIIFSPSGRRCVTLSGADTNPYPVAPPRTSRSVALWEIRL